MTVNLVKIEILSVYPETKPNKIMLPQPMAQCTPDTLKALQAIRDDLRAAGGDLALSDLFRTYEMQMQSHMDFVNHKKKAFSPAPGGSMHEAGRACDLDLDKLKMKLSDFWEIAKKHGMRPIIGSPDSGASEAWHFDCRGSHDIVYQYYKSGKGTNMDKYEAMSASGILAIGVKVDRFGHNQSGAALQAALIRLGFELGNIDGQVGNKTKTALAAAGIASTDTETALAAAVEQLKAKFPEEFPN
jgi:hypothetical protein